MSGLGSSFQVRAGEGRVVLAVAAVALVHTAGVTLGDDLAQSLFVARASAAALPRIFLLKAVLDLVAAAIYAPLVRGRDAGRVLELCFAIYAAAATAAAGLSHLASPLAAYGFYGLVEAAWTLITIHFGVYLLEVFDASQARRLFPLLFTATRLGGFAAGALLGSLVERIGASTMFLASAGLTLTAAFMVRPLRQAGAAAAPTAESPAAAQADDEALPVARKGRLAELFASPLFRAIAVSTALMVVVRYGMRISSADQIATALDHDETAMAELAGLLSAVGNLVSAGLALLVVPRLLHRLGVGALNLGYAVTTVGAQLALLLRPSLASAAAARFVEVPFKDAFKTPLSALFYGGERPARRSPARAAVFGLVIPAATVATGLVFEVVHPGPTLAALGVVIALAFAVTSWQQNRAFRASLVDLVDWKLGQARAAGQTSDAAAVAGALAALDELATTAPRLARDAALRTALAEALVAADPRLRAIAEELLTEVAPRAAAHHLAAGLRPAAVTAARTTPR